MLKCVNGAYIEITPEEEEEMRLEGLRAEVLNRKRPLAFDEVVEMYLRQNVNVLEVDDATALRMAGYYPEWAVNESYSVGFKCVYDGRLFRCLQAHTSIETWNPVLAPSLWTEICEEYTGEEFDPIPYNGNMALEQGKYYVQNGDVYHCIRSTGNPVYHALSELVGLYVEE